MSDIFEGQYPLEIGGNVICTNSGEFVAYTEPDAPDEDERARRIVACVNACRGYDIQKLEDALAGGFTVSGLSEYAGRQERMFQAAIRDLAAINRHMELDPNDGGADPIIEAVDELKQQRDELLTVLNGMLDGYDGNICDGLFYMTAQFMSDARAAIAKAEG